MKRISLAVCLSLLPLTTHAAGLGKMTVFSGLGEPLSAEIDLSASSAELSSLSARIASGETYTQQGVERQAALSGVRVTLGSKPDGTPVLKISSPYPVDEPFLNLLVQVDWATGRLLREYTTLLDPPGYGDRAASAPAPVAPAAAPARANGGGLDSDSAASVRSRAPAAATPAETYRTQRGDTLRSIARQLQPADDVSLEQMLVGLFNANRGAFINDNMNQLQVGKILRVPKTQELQAVSRQQALQQVRVHAANWNAYRNQLAAAVGQSAPADDSAAPPSQTASGKIAAATDRSQPAAAGPRDVVRLSQGEAPGAGPATTGNGSGETLRALEEDSIAQERALEEVSARIAFFEKQIQDMQQLLAVQNQILAEMQKNGQAAAAAPATAAPEAAKPQAAAQQDAAAGGVWGYLRDNPLLLGAAGGGVLLLLAGLAFERARRRKAEQVFERDLLMTPAIEPAAEPVQAAPAAAPGNALAAVTAAAAPENRVAAADGGDADPLAEAEVYLAYGRGAQAEEILKDAVARSPMRHELHYKLLEIYADRKDAAAYATLAGGLLAALGAGSAEWLKVAAAGHALDPQNPLYAAAAEAAHDAETPQDAAAGLEAPDAEAEAMPADESAGAPLSELPALDLPEPPAADAVQLDAAELGLASPGAAAGDDELAPLEFELPELAAAPVVAEDRAPADEDAAPGFDLPELASFADGGQDALEMGTLGLSPAEDEVDALAPLLPPLDVAEDDSSEADDWLAAQTQSSVPAIPEVSEPVAEDDLLPEQVDLEAPVADLDFDFDLGNEAGPDTLSDAAAGDAPELPGLDFSGISLSLDNAMAAEEAAAAEAEPPEVDTKLDLVTAYMDMEDTGVARALLDEIMQEGGPQQRERARKILDSLR